MFVSAKELREMSLEKLLKELPRLENEYMNMRQQKHSKSAERDDVREAKKNVARCKAVIREKKLHALLEGHEDSKSLPKQLRPRLTKALRNKLTKKQLNTVTIRKSIKRLKYPAQVFSFNAN